MTWYTGDLTYDTVLTAALLLAAVTAVVTPRLQPPYGRFASDRFGISVSPRLGWFLMELPSTLSFLLFYFLGPNSLKPVPLVFLAIWLIHYANRGFIFPYLIRTPTGAKASFSLMVVFSGWIVTTFHGYLNGSFISTFSTHYTTDWLTDPRFITGLVIYYVSFALNIHSDAILRNLRSHEEVASGEKIYRIPQGGLFRWVSCPSYLTELTAWIGFAICTWSLAGVFIVAISLANLVPRAFATHAWYGRQFPDYPAGRRALVPLVA